MTETVVQEESITALKAFAALTGTVQTGAASHCHAGLACPLAWR